MTAADIEVELPCDGWAHWLARVGHIPTQAASFALFSACCGFRVFICAGRARFIREESGMIHCASCDRDSSSSTWTCKLITF